VVKIFIFFMTALRGMSALSSRDSAVRPSNALFEIK